MKLVVFKDTPSGSSSWRCQEWWPLFTAGLEFVTGLVSGSHGSASSAVVSDVCVFLGSHEHLLVESATLLRHTADPGAAELIHSLVGLISALSARPIFWGALHPSVRDTLIKCMYLSYDSTVNLLLRPRILKFIIDGISVESPEDLQSCDERQLSGELRLFINKLILVNTCCAQCFVRFSPRLNNLVDTIDTQDNFWYTPMAEMNFGPPQMSMTSGPRLTYGTIISSTQLFTQAQWHYLLSRLNSSSRSTSLSASKQPPGSGRDPGSPSPSTSLANKDDRIDSARREWERANPEDLRRVQAKDLRKILGSSSSSLGPSVLASTSSTSRISLSGLLTGHELTVPLLSTPRLIKRPFDPLICDNIILSKATALGPLPGRSSRASPGAGPRRSPSRDSINTSGGAVGGFAVGFDPTRDPWFDSMDEDNTLLGLEINLVLILCQALEGVGSPRLAARDRQLIGRETATELGIFFEFLESLGQQPESSQWRVSATLVDQDPRKTRHVSVSPEIERKLPARLHDGTTINQSIVVEHKNDSPSNEEDENAMELTCMEKETRSGADVISTGAFKVNIDSAKFLPLLGKLLKSVVKSLDSAQFG